MNIPSEENRDKKVTAPFHEIKTPEWSKKSSVEFVSGKVFQCGYRVLLNAEPEDIWPAIKSIGGDKGWYYANLLWYIRGRIDKFIGGVGIRRGRRHPMKLEAGETLDFWVVLRVNELHRLHLLAEMIVPGEALLKFDIESINRGQTELIQNAQFLPSGFWGRFYWYSFYPIHKWIFHGMMKSIAKSINCKILEGPVLMK
jgi:hypothetical protein